MSASLVGSEMCIRDSVNRVNLHPLTTATRQTRPPTMGRAAPTALTGPRGDAQRGAPPEKDWSCNPPEGGRPAAFLGEAPTVLGVGLPAPVRT
eukprot:4558937-Alexandrium_andersonii.AAC.1